MELAKEHFTLFKSFLPVKSIHSKTNARQKLVKLTQNQFGELSTDVYDELTRRKKENDPFLPSNSAFHPKRNQARQKLATLSLSRFEELISDVYNELVIRFPTLLDGMDKTQLSNHGHSRRPSNSSVTVKTRKSSVSYAKRTSNVPVNFTTLDNLMADLGGMITTAESDQKETKMKTGKEDKDLAEVIRERDQTIFNLTQDAEMLKHDSEDQIRNLTEKLTAMTEQVNILKQKNQEQEKRTSEFRGEASNLLAEMKTLSIENAGLRGTKETANSQTAELKAQIAEFREQSQAGRIRIQELEALVQELETGKRESDKEFDQSERPISQASIIPRVNTKRKNPNIDFGADNVPGSEFLPLESMKEYYDAVNQILEAIRTLEVPNTNILVAMKAIVGSCKTLTQNCQSFEEKARPDSRTLATLGLIKTDMSQILEYQMVLTKRLSVAADEYAQSEIEVALRSLTSVILDLYYSIDDFSVLKTPSPEQSSLLHEKRSGDKKSPPVKDYQSPKPQSNMQEMARVKNILELETDRLVKSIQNLLQLLKTTPCSDPELDEAVDQISNIVSSLVGVSEQPLLVAGIECEDIIEMLEKNRKGLFSLIDNLKNDPSNKTLKQQIASSSYEIAKFVKNLIEIV